MISQFQKLVEFTKYKICIIIIFFSPKKSWLDICINFLRNQWSASKWWFDDTSWSEKKSCIVGRLTRIIIKTSIKCWRREWQYPWYAMHSIVCSDLKSEKVQFWEFELIAWKAKVGIFKNNFNQSSSERQQGNFGFGNFDIYPLWSTTTEKGLLSEE